MAFSSATVAIGKNTKKSDYDRVLDNTQYLKAEDVHEKKTFQSSTVFNALATFDKPVIHNSSTTFNATATFNVAINGSAIIAQTQLKTSTGEVSHVGAIALFTLPGGEYGFYPQVKVGGNGNAGGAGIGSLGTNYKIVNTTYGTTIVLSAGSLSTTYAQQRYVTSSGEVFWIFLLIDKKNNQVISGYQSPDHVCFGNGGDAEKISHPFRNYNSKTGKLVVMGPSRNSEEKEVDLIVINPLHNDIIRMRKECKEVDKSLLQYIIEDFTYEDIKTPMYPEKNGEAGYPTTLITVGLENDEDWNLEGKPVKVIKKAIKRPEYIKIKKLVDIIVTM